MFDVYSISPDPIYTASILQASRAAQLLRRSGLTAPTLAELALPRFGNLLIRWGEKLQQSSRLTSEPASVASLLISL